MKLHSTSIAVTARSPAELLKATERLAQLTVTDDKRAGWTYYSNAHAIKVAQLVLRLHSSESKQATIDTSKVAEQPSTIRARIVQGKAYLLAKGTECLASGFTPDERAVIMDNIDSLEVSVRRASILLRLKKAVVDFMDALTIVEKEEVAKTPEGVSTFNEEVFRVELLNFVNSAAFDTQMEFQHLPKSAIKYAETVAQQDDSILVEQMDHITVVMKLTPEAKAQLNTP
jgi:hypothetical protein